MISTVIDGIEKFPSKEDHIVIQFAWDRWAG
jgi:hypothetical protein